MDSEGNKEKVTIEYLKELGKDAEIDGHYPTGRFIDGAPYTCMGSRVKLFLDAAINFYGFTEMQNMVIKRKENGEEKADKNCGNWIFWTLLLELGVNCEKP